MTPAATRLISAPLTVITFYARFCAIRYWYKYYGHKQPPLGLQCKRLYWPSSHCLRVLFVMVTAGFCTHVEFFNAKHSAARENKVFLLFTKINLPGGYRLVVAITLNLITHIGKAVPTSRSQWLIRYQRCMARNGTRQFDSITRVAAPCSETVALANLSNRLYLPLAHSDQHAPLPQAIHRPLRRLLTMILIWSPHQILKSPLLKAGGKLRMKAI